VSKQNPQTNPVSIIRLIAASLFVLLALAAATAQSQMVTVVAAPPATTGAQDANASLATLPTADALVYISPRRILNDAVPHIMSEKDLAGTWEAMTNLKTMAGIDPRTVDYLVILSRVKKPGDDLSFSMPDFMVVTSGDFDGSALMDFVRQAAKDKLREETYNSKSISVLTIDELAAQAVKTPILKSLSQIGIVMLNGNTIAVGTVPYLKSAIDAAAGTGRINPDLLSSAMRDPNALVSFVGSPWTAFAKTFALLGTEHNPRTPKCDMRLGDYYGSLTMEGNSFKLRVAVNADNPDTAKIITSLVTMGFDAVAANVKDSRAQAALKGLSITPTETEVLIQADISQQAVADVLKEMTTSKKTPPAESSPSTSRRPAKKRVTRRRTSKTT
jgi:hypothetical protein